MQKQSSLFGKTGRKSTDKNLPFPFSITISILLRLACLTTALYSHKCSYIALGFCYFISILSSMPSGALSQLIIHLLYNIIFCQFIAYTSCSSVIQGVNSLGGSNQSWGPCSAFRTQSILTGLGLDFCKF